MAKIRKPRKKDLPTVEERIQNQQPTQEQVEQEVTAIENDATLAPRKRIWEVDFLRGFMILFVVWDHFMWDVYYGSSGFKTGLFQWLEQVARNYYGTNGLRALTHDTFVSMFVFTSGVSCAFSNSNGKRAIKMICFALLLSAATYAASSILQADNIVVNFNVIHVIALSVLIWAGLEWLVSKFKKDWQHNLYGWIMFAIVITVLIVGYQAKVKSWTNENPIWFFLAEHSFFVPGFSEYWGGDYLPFFPDFGWFLVGAFLGKHLYKEKTTLFPKFNAKWVSPVTFCGKYSIWVYFGTQVVMYGFFYLFGELLGWL